MLRPRASACLATAARTSPSKGKTLASQDRLLQASSRARHPDGSASSARNAAHIGNIQKFEPVIFSSLRTLFPAPNPQPSPFHVLAHSFTHSKKLTPAFPVTSTLFARSLTRVQYSTPLLSAACALFRKTTREGVGATDLLLPNKNIITQSNFAVRSLAPAGSAAADFVTRPRSAVAHNKGPADKIDTNTSCAVSFRDR